MPPAADAARLNDISVHLVYDLQETTDLLLQIEVPDFADQRVQSSHTELSDNEHMFRVTAEDGVGERMWVRAGGRFVCDYTARVRIDRPVLDLSTLPSVPPHLLPGETVRYLMPSRYCPSDLFQSFVLAEFGDLEGGARIAAMRDWIFGKFTYVPGSSDAQTTALDSFVMRQGVCRDYAHVMIALARASAIPARFASVYAPSVEPPDFHAVVEVFLDGTWHLVDATGMSPADEIARIGVGMDAAEVSFLSSFGPITLVEQQVKVTTVDG